MGFLVEIKLKIKCIITITYFALLIASPPILIRLIAIPVI
jgi:hypothetical protein